jgi:hypothetical protein
MSATIPMNTLLAVSSAAFTFTRSRSKAMARVTARPSERGEACGLEGIWKQPHVILERLENTLRGLANGAYRFGSRSSLGTSRFN